jgi:hypothetical protein
MDSLILIPVTIAIVAALAWLASRRADDSYDPGYDDPIDHYEQRIVTPRTIELPRKQAGKVLYSVDRTQREEAKNERVQAVSPETDR